MATIIQGSADSTFGGTIESTGIDDNATSTAITIDSSENVGIGRTTMSYPLEVSGDILCGTSGNTLRFGRSGQSDGARIQCNNSSDLLFFNNGGNERMRILAGGGLTFNGDTAAANALDDYEEGTWTVSLTGTTESLTDNSGKYTKIGNVVYFTWYSSAMTLASSTGAAKINGLPFVALAGNDYSLFYYNHGNAVDGDSRGGYINAGSDYMSFIDKNSTATSSYIDGGAKYIMVSGFYYV